MAQVTGPLLSFDASGSVGGAITFAKWKGRPYVRQLVIPSNPKSDGQVAQRAMQKFLSQAWASIGDSNQATFEAIAAQNAYSPFNGYTSLNLKRWTDFNGPSQTATIPAAGTNPVLGTATVTPGSGLISISQPVTTLNAGWGLAVYVGASDAADPVKSETKLVIPFNGTTTITGQVSGLAPGTYYVALQAYKTTGAKGALGAWEEVIVT